jgi:hypothetical protein
MPNAEAPTVAAPATGKSIGRQQVAVLSTRSTVVGAEHDRSLEEMIFETTSAALADAGLSLAELDGVVLSGNDQTDGRVISCMTSAGPAAGVGKDVTMIASSADHALVYGYLRLRSGQGRNVLVVGWGKPSESVHPEHAELVSAEPFILRNVGMNDTLAAALQASRWADDDAGTIEAPVSWPLSKKDLPSRADAVHAAVLAIDGAFPQGTELAWVSGAGWATDAYDLGSRDLSDLAALRAAAAQIADRSSDTDSAWDIAEIAAPSEPAVAAAVAALSLGKGTSINPSGSLAARPAPAHVAGLDRMLAAIRAVKNETGSPATGERPMTTIGIGMQGFAAQGATIMVFSDRKESA